MGLFSNLTESWNLNNDAADFALYYDRFMKNYDIFTDAYYKCGRDLDKMRGYTDQFLGMRSLKSKIQEIVNKHKTDKDDNFFTFNIRKNSIGYEEIANAIVRVEEASRDLNNIMGYEYFESFK